MKTSNALAVWALLVAHSQACAQPVRIETGLIEGIQSGASTVYKSIPFAAPPVGELRWRAPQPVPTWNGVRRADKFGPICTQTGASVPGAPHEPVSEDCLTLSIWTPAKSREQKLPVMVWIPGGGFTQESASMPLYWGDALVTRGVIVVTINYRVGLLGFLSHPELTRESGHHSSGNYLTQEPWKWSDADRALANMMATYWTNFAKSGDPNGDGVPLWPNFTTDRELVLHFNDAATVGSVPNLEWLRRLDHRYLGLRGATKALENSSKVPQ